MESNTFYDRQLQVKITSKQKDLISILTDILGEDRSKIVRRLIMAEAKRAAAYIDDEEELELWMDLINDIEKDEDMHEFEVGEAISAGRKQAYFERTGKELTWEKETEMETETQKQRRWQKNFRMRKKMEALKKVKEKWD